MGAPRWIYYIPVSFTVDSEFPPKQVKLAHVQKQSMLCSGARQIYNNFRTARKYNYRPQTKFAKVRFSQVSVCRQGGVYPIACWDTHTPLRGGSRNSRRRGRQPSRRGANLQFCQKFPKNCMKLRTFWAVGGACAGSTPP